jgi:formylglycine-generating enzyme required for sulfatase activity
MNQSDQGQSNRNIKKVFISYAKEDIAIAEKVDAFLRGRGFEVFRDRRDINPSEEIWLEIDRALGESDALVLLASPATMPYHRESYREWLPYDLLNKPIYPLYLRDCTFFLRLMVYKYIDARTDLDRGLAELVAAFSGTFQKPDPMSPEEFKEIKLHHSVDLIEYRLGRIAEWSQPRYQIDKRFVTLSLSLDRGENEQERWRQVDQFKATDLREVLVKTRAEHPVLVLLGKPGSGKSTLLRRLELDHCLDRKADRDGEISFLVQLNGYQSEDPNQVISPLDWLKNQWEERHPKLGSLVNYLEEGRVLLLLDALNEMPIPQTSSYENLVSQWRKFAQKWARKNNRIIFSCRSLDYSFRLSSETLPVPHLSVQPMDEDQVRSFIQSYAPAYLEPVMNHLKDPRQFEFYQSPYFLRLLCRVLEYDQRVPEGRAALFTGFIRALLNRELNRPDTILSKESLLHRLDRSSLNENQWDSPFDLPEMGPLIGQLSRLAYEMQSDHPDGAANEIRITYQKALSLLEHQNPDEVVDAGLALSILDRYGSRQITFFHQLLQEYFAARRLANSPKPELAHQEWRREQVVPRYEDIIKDKDSWEPAPPLPPTGWEETVVTAAPMAEDPAGFIRSLIPHNLVLAARCAGSTELRIDDRQREVLKRELRDLLLRQMRDPEADLRARLAAGEALGAIGHPEFELRKGEFGDFLLPPFESVFAGIYPFGEENQPVELGGFQMGRYPVTNAEFALFIAAGGYHDAQWWDTEAAQDWLRGSNPQAPKYWNNTHLNNAAQPVVGVNWYEARAYCNWLTASLASSRGQALTGGGEEQVVRLPTEPEFEAAARGREGRIYPYGNDYEPRLCNTADNCIGRSSPVGLFENRSPFGIYDLSGNVWEWCINEHGKPFEEPTRINLGGADWRPLRGGSWGNDQDFARAVFRFDHPPNSRSNVNGFRVVSVVRPPS